MKKKTLLTTGDVAAHCHVSYDTVANWIRSDKLRAFTTPGGHRRISIRDFNEFLTEYGMPLFEEESAQQKRVLVVDDDPLVVKTIVKFLNDTGEYEVETAADGFEAGLQINRFNPDLVILDLMMPNIDGFKVCQKIKSTRQTRHIKILVLTGYASPENIQKALECGAHLCLAKPFRTTDLREKIDELLTGDSPRSERASQGG